MSFQFDIQFHIFADQKIGNMINLKSLNSEQKKAVEYNNGPLMIVAGAGSGKTRVLNL